MAVSPSVWTIVNLFVPMLVLAVAQVAVLVLARRNVLPIVKMIVVQHVQ